VCGRFTLSTAADILQQLFEIDAGPMPELAARYNIAPTQDVAVVRAADGGAREMVLARWGLIPFWAREPDIGSRLINARLETAADKPAFRSAFAARRCLLPADGFYEWAKADGAKQPYLFRLQSGGPFGLAGLWDRWRFPDGQTIDTCTILTTEADEVVAPVHPRMPVIVGRASYGAWLDPSNRRADAVRGLVAGGAGEMLVGYTVSRRVNTPTADDPGLVEPLS